jgi:hypothetical protein
MLLESQLLPEESLHPPLNGIQILGRSNVVASLFVAASQGEVLGHDTIDVNSVNACLLEALSESDNVRSIVKLASLDETARPSKDGGDGVRGGLTALLVLTVVTGDSAVGSLRLKGLAVGGDENRCHQTERAKALSDNVGLNIAVVV